VDYKFESVACDNLGSEVQGRVERYDNGFMPESNGDQQV
jgi:hypothetical protein